MINGNMYAIYLHPLFRFGFLPFLGGLAYAAGFPNKNDTTFFLGPLIGMGYLLWILFPKDSEKNAENRLFKELGAVLSFSVGHYLLGFYWIPYTIEVFGQVPFPFNQTLGLFFSLIILPQFLVFLLLKYILIKFEVRRLWPVATMERSHLFFALSFTLLEYFTPQQFPSHLGHPWLSFAPYLGTAPIWGVAGFSFFSYYLLLILISFFQKQGLNKMGPLFIAVFIALNMATPLTKPSLETENIQSVNIRMVQPNIGNYLKVSSESGDSQSLGQVLDLYYQLTTAPAEKPLDLIIWPETAYPRLLSSSLMKSSPLYSPRLVQDSLKAHQAELFFGGYDQVTKEVLPSDYFETEYNSAFLVNSDGLLKDVYHKRVLIPFGESLPFGPFNKYLSQLIQNISFFARGENFTLFQTERHQSFISVICYEILFSSYVRTYLNQVERHPLFLINLTNDSWYGDTAEPFQHLFLAKWRALEFDIPILRMTNTGITSVIYPDGTESSRLLPFTLGNLDEEVPLKVRTGTWFQFLGVWGIVLLVFGLYGLNEVFNHLFLKRKNPLS